MRVFAKKNGAVLAACDENLLGKKFEEKDLVLEVKKSFYAGELVGEEELSEMLAEAENINLVGEQTINIAKRNKLVGRVGAIDGVPYVMIFRL